MRRSPQGERFEALADRIAQSLAFMEACGFDAARTPVWCCDPMHGNTVTS